MEALELTRHALLILSPYVAQGALSKIGENTTDQVTQVVGRAWRLLQGGAQANPKAASALEVYQEEPDDERNRERLAKYLAASLEQQHQMMSELHAVIGQLQQTRQAGIQATVTTTGTNFGQQAGINYGTMSQNQQSIRNNAPNQGAQGVFEGPITFNQQRTAFNQQGQTLRSNQYNANRDIIQTNGDMMHVSGDYVDGDKMSGDIINAQQSQGFVNQPTGPVTQQFGDADTLARAFAQVYETIKARRHDPDVDEDEIAETVQAIHQEAQKGNQANERKLGRWLRNLAGMAEDIFDGTVSALTGSQTDAATVAGKVAARAKQEREQR
jgi:hypothetical protein